MHSRLRLKEVIKMLDYVRFNREDRNYAFCTLMGEPTKGFEPVFSIGFKDYPEVLKLLDFFKKKGIVADYDDWVGLIRILPERELKIGRRKDGL